MEGIFESEHEFKNRLAQSLGQCKVRARLEKVNENLPRVAMEVTFTYTKNAMCLMRMDFE